MNSEESQHWRRQSGISPHPCDELLGRQSTSEIRCATPEVSNPRPAFAFNHRGYIYDGEWRARFVICYTTLHEDTLSP